MWLGKHLIYGYCLSPFSLQVHCQYINAEFLAVMYINIILTIFFNFLKIFIFSIMVDLQCSVNFCCTEKWPSHTHTHTQMSFYHIILHRIPSQVTSYSYLCYTTRSHFLSKMALSWWKEGSRWIYFLWMFKFLSMSDSNWVWNKESK